MATFSKRGRRWQAKIRRRGYPPQSETFPTKGEAEQWAREVERKMDRGEFVALTADDRRLTLAEAIDRYLEEVTPRKRGRVREANRLKAWQKHEFAARTLSAVRAHDLARYRNARLADKASPNTVRLELAAISHVFTIARSEWGLEALANPVAAVVKPGTSSRARTRRLEDGEEARLLENAPRVAAWLRSTVQLAIATAMRAGELATLTWQQIDAEHHTARLDLTKNGDRRDVPLTEAAIAALRALAGKDELPAAGAVIGVTSGRISHAFIKLTTLAGIEDLHFHDLRHEATSRLFERGDLDIVEIAAITGHKTLGMLKRYTHPRAREIAKKMRSPKAPPKSDQEERRPEA